MKQTQLLGWSLIAWASLVLGGQAQEPNTAPQCTNGALIFGLLNGGEPGACPLPEGLLPPQVEAVLSDASSASDVEVVRALRKVAERLDAKDAWGRALAARIRRALETYRKGEAVNAAFAKIEQGVARHEPCGCAWVVDAAGGGPDSACYRFAQGDPFPECKIDDLVIDFPGWPAAAEAYVYLDRIRAGLVALNSKERCKVRTRITAARNRWSALRKHGYFQYPWELWLSNLDERYGGFTACWADDLLCTGEEGLDPERWRWIFLHPGMGLGFDGFGKDPDPSLDAAFVLSVEAFGFLQYARDFSWYWGLSLGAGAASGSFDDPRLGAFLHFTRFVHVGYLLSVIKESRLDATIFVAVDLAGWIGRGLTYAGFDE